MSNQPSRLISIVEDFHDMVHLADHARTATHFGDRFGVDGAIESSFARLLVFFVAAGAARPLCRPVDGALSSQVLDKL